MADFDVRNLCFLGLANGGMDRTFGLGGGSYANLDEAANAVIERSGVVAFVAEFLESLPNFFVCRGERLGILG